MRERDMRGTEYPSVGVVLEMAWNMERSVLLWI